MGRRQRSRQQEEFCTQKEFWVIFGVIVGIVVLISFLVLAYQSDYFWWGIGAGVGTPVLGMLARAKLQQQWHWALILAIGFVVTVLIWGYGAAEELGVT